MPAVGCTGGIIQYKRNSWWTHLDDISILDDGSQQLAVFRLILLLLQVSSMLHREKHPVNPE